MAPADREARILEGAVAFFADVGFEGGTRELAARLGITQPLLYRYFPSKEVLLDRVYQEVYLSRWNPQWEKWLTDRSRPLEKRLTAFYQDYAQVIMTYEWVRLFMFAGLKGLDFNARYIAFLRATVFDKVVLELRVDCGQEDTSPVRDEEVELVWGLHAAIYYLGVRRWIYRMPMPADLDRDIALRVSTFLGGFSRVYADA
ncbi:TetR/AcrR family transcriptional regulator [Roseomonas populi]|uniref:TetR/AcrR family transcriptional regulator n=1 Tax=Roseomonas populi TaxID=3121582 RepID=A0ABT1XBB0_9PROT|nr:TetR/AcrR family transcriptional regulator [Roseomonas pecuniae]MCR0985036.1 TetR/AcrR family transcriptional regulator [Roseomonas pecuniae]